MKGNWMLVLDNQSQPVQPCWYDEPKCVPIDRFAGRDWYAEHCTFLKFLYGPDAKPIPHGEESSNEEYSANFDASIW